MAYKPDTFAEYLQRRGYDMNELTHKFVNRMERQPESIFKFYEREYPDELVAWKTIQRILG